MCPDNIVINSYIDNVLSEQESLLIKEHISQCQKCSNLFNSYKTLVSTINNLPEPKVSDNFFDSLFEKIETETHPAFEELSGFYDQPGHSEIKEHIASCSVCQDQLNNINVLSRTVAGLDNYQASQVFFDNLAAKIDNLVIDNSSEKDLSDDTEIYQAAPDFFDGLMSRIEGLSDDNEADEGINCISSEDLSAYLDNEATNIAVSDIESHLETCSKCKSKYSSFKISRETVLFLQQPAVPFNFSRKVMDDINQKEKKIIKFLPFFSKPGHRASMVAGIIIAGLLVTMSRNVIEQPEQTQTAAITVRSEDLLFSPGSSTYRTDSFEVLADNSRDDSLEIEDIGL